MGQDQVHERVSAGLTHRGGQTWAGSVEEHIRHAAVLQAETPFFWPCSNTNPASHQSHYAPTEPTAANLGFEDASRLDEAHTWFREVDAHGSAAAQGLLENDQLRVRQVEQLPARQLRQP